MSNKNLLGELPFAKLTTYSFAELYQKPGSNDYPYCQENELIKHIRQLTNSEMAEAIDFDYYTTSRTNERYNKIKKDNELSLLHLNVRSLNANYRGLLMLISQFTFDFD